MEAGSPAGHFLSVGVSIFKTQMVLPSPISQLYPLRDPGSETKSTDLV